MARLGLARRAVHAAVDPRRACGYSCGRHQACLWELMGRWACSRIVVRRQARQGVSFLDSHIKHEPQPICGHGVHYFWNYSGAAPDLLVGTLAALGVRANFD